MARMGATTCDHDKRDTMKGGWIWFALVIVSATVVGCSKDHCGPCAKDSDCGSGLACDPGVHVCKSPSDNRAACDVDCADDCDKRGHCTAKGGRCVIGGLADCQRSGICRSEGRCGLGVETWNKGIPRCVAVSDADCKKSSSCKGLALCTLSGGECIVGSDGDCANSERCTKNHECRKNNDSYCMQ